MGKGALELAQAVKRDPAIDMRRFEIWIELNCQIEISDCEGNVAVPVCCDSLLTIEPSIFDRRFGGQPIRGKRLDEVCG